MTHIEQVKSDLGKATHSLIMAKCVLADRWQTAAERRRIALEYMDHAASVIADARIIVVGEGDAK